MKINIAKFVRILQANAWFFIDSKLLGKYFSYRKMLYILESFLLCILFSFLIYLGLIENSDHSDTSKTFSV
jgi:hypothetical protein